MAAYKVIGTGPKGENGTILHNGREYKPGDAFPATDATATPEDIAVLVKAKQLVPQEPVPVAESVAPSKRR